MRPYRKQKVASVIRQVIGEAIVHRLNDPRVAPLTTVMRVEVTGDLLIARVYLSVQGDQAAEQRTLRAMRHAAGYIQRMLARRLPIRQCPELRFEIDEGIKGARRTMELLAENRRSEPELFEPQGDDDPPAPDDVHRLDGPNGGSSETLGVGE